MRYKISEKNISYLGVNPYKKLGKIVHELRRLYRLRYYSGRNTLTQEMLGNLINLNRKAIDRMECGNRKIDLFEAKDIAGFFSQHSPEMLQLKRVLDTYFPVGNHNTRDIHKQTGNLICQSRIAIGISRNELSRLTGIDVTLLWRIESGSIRIHLLEVWAIARILRECEEFRQLDDALSSLLIESKTNQFLAS